MKILIPMAGRDEIFRNHGFVYAKPLIEIDGRPAIEHAFDSIKTAGEAKYVFVIRKDDDLRFHLRDVLRLLSPDAAIIRADGETAGAACTALLAIDELSDDDELVIANSDQVIDTNLGEAIAYFRRQELDAATIVFDSVHPRWSFVKTNEHGLVVEAAEKRPLSRNATAGFYYFKRSSYFVNAAMQMIRKGAAINGGYFVCPVFNELILDQKRIGIHRIDRRQYISLATPQALEDYEQTLAARKREGKS